jgi:hypothetical protein
MVVSMSLGANNLLAFRLKKSMMLSHDMSLLSAKEQSKAKQSKRAGAYWLGNKQRGSSDVCKT